MSVYEVKRLTALRQLNLLDTTPSESFDRITRMASRIFNLPIAAVSLSDEDRQWFKSRVGVEHQEIPRYRACCGEVADTSAMVVVEDLLQSATYRNSVLADSGIRFYAGAPLTTREGYTLGAMCVLGTEPRVATQGELDALTDLAAMVMAQIDLQHAVGRIDAVTALPNYLQFVEDLEDLARDQPDAPYYALSTEVVDLSQASSLQRIMGPSYLEDLSRTAAEQIREVLANSTRLYHIGPCQFAHLDAGNGASVVERARRLRTALLSLSRDPASPFMLSPVVGIAPFRTGEATPGSILRTAHSASRDARDAEKPVGVYSAASDASHQRRFGLLASFAQALENDAQLRMVYQPRMDLATSRCVGAEALIRWCHPTLGEISPAEFIALIENTTMIRPLTDWVLRSAIRQSAMWFRQNAGLRTSINIAASNLEETDLLDRIMGYLEAEGLPCAAIELELTESGLISNGRAATQQLEALMATGIKIAIDDFGTGYSSLTYLQRIAAHIVKIDRSFIEDLENNARSQTLVRSMVSMAHDLGYTVVAEGVETRECAEFLESLRCDELQGYLFSRPLEAEDFEKWLLAYRHERS